MIQKNSQLFEQLLKHANLFLRTFLRIYTLAIPVIISTIIATNLVAAQVGYRPTGSRTGMNFDSGFGNFGEFASMPMPNEEQMEEVYKYINSLSPEEYRELEEFGKQLLSEYEARGVPVFNTTPAQQAQPTQSAPPKKQEPVQQIKPPVDKQAPEEHYKKPYELLDKTQKIAHNIASLIAIIGSIRQKAVSEEQLNLLLSPLAERLNLLVFYLYRLEKSEHLKRLQHTEFDDLRNILEWLNQECAPIDEKFYVPERNDFLTKKARAEHKNLLSQAHMMLELFITTVTQAFIARTVLTKCEEFFKKYDPEVLKIKEKIEREEKDAWVQAGRSLTHTSAKPEIISYKSHHISPHHAYAPAHQNHHFAGSNYMSPQNFGPGHQKTGKEWGTTQNQQKSSRNQQKELSDKTKKQDEKNKVKKDEKEEKDSETPDQKRDKSLSEGFEKIKKLLVELNTIATTSKDKIAHLRQAYDRDPDTVPVHDIYASPILDALGNLRITASRAIGSVKDWYKIIDKSFNTSREQKRHTDILKKFATAQLGSLTEVSRLLKDIKFATNQAAEELYQHDISKCNKQIKELYEQLDIKYGGVTTGSSRTGTQGTS